MAQVAYKLRDGHLEEVHGRHRIIVKEPLMQTEQLGIQVGLVWRNHETIRREDASELHRDDSMSV